MGLILSSIFYIAFSRNKGCKSLDLLEFGRYIFYYFEGLSVAVESLSLAVEGPYKKGPYMATDGLLAATR